MIESTPLLRSVLVVVVFAVVITWAIAFRAVHGTKGHAWNVVLAIWLGFTWVAAYRGWLSFEATPPKFPFFVFTAVIVVTIAAYSKSGLALVKRLPLWFLIGFQAFRIPVEWFLHEAYREGLIGAQMTYAGMNFDIASGIGAAIIGVWALVATPPRWVLWLWNAAGTVLLIIIVTITLLSTPIFNAFPDGPPNTLVAAVPFVWLPMVLVPAAWFGHLLMWRRLSLGLREQ